MWKLGIHPFVLITTDVYWKKMYLQYCKTMYFNFVYLFKIQIEVILIYVHVYKRDFFIISPSPGLKKNY